MKYKCKTEYVIFENPEIQIFVSKKYTKGYLRIFYRPTEDETREAEPWIEGLYSDIKILEKEEFIDKPVCYVLLRGKDGKGMIVELLKREIIIKGFQYNDFFGFSKKKQEEGACVDAEQDEYVISFNRKHSKIYILYSTSHEILFEPFHYKTIDIYNNGVILNEHMAVENNGTLINLLFYSKAAHTPVFTHKGKGEKLIFLDEGGAMLHKLAPSSYSKEILSVEVGTRRYDYDTNKDTFSWVDYDETCGEWSQEELLEAAEIAYGGRLPLDFFE